MRAFAIQALTKTLENPFINVTSSGYSGNWLLGFITYVQQAHPSITLAPGCTNPYVGRMTGPLAMLVVPTVIKGYAIASQSISCCCSCCVLVCC